MVICVVGSPKQANAGLFDFLGIGSNNIQASAAVAIADTAPVSNSQTITLPETSINPDVKNIKDSSGSAIVDDEAISPDGLEGTDSVTNSYISSSDKINAYTVKKGDTLGDVATKFGISKNTILYANTGIKNNTLKVGQTLIILPIDGVSYTVKKGDTLASIAKAHKADPDDIAQYNDISDKSLIIGDKIIVPGGIAIKKAEPAPVAKAEKEQHQAKTPEKIDNTSDSSSDNIPENTPTSPAAPADIASGSGITGGYIWPFPSGTGRVSQRLHDDNAYDFSAPKGTPIYAIADGTVLIADGSGYNGGYGLYVVIDFNDGGQAIFGHMSKVATYAGEAVKQGDIIGYVGSTGRSTGPHVHIGYRGGKPNPYRNLPKGTSL